MSKRRMAAAAILLSLGVLVGLSSFDNSRLNGVPGSAKLQLIAVGFCIGMGFGILVVPNRIRRY